MEHTPHIAVVLGTARTGRNSEHVATYIVDTIMAAGGAEAQLYDVRDYMSDRTIPDWQPDGEAEKTAGWRAVAAKADAFVMVVPEYNSGYPGEWKIVMDQDGKNYMGKPAIVAGVSSGGFMGARVIEHIRPIMVRLGFICIHAPLFFGNVGSFVEATADDRDEQYKNRVLKSVSKLLLFEGRLRGMNAELNTK
jgi:NAD(P)H-dependent FMN reductase